MTKYYHHSETVLVRNPARRLWGWFTFTFAVTAIVMLIMAFVVHTPEGQYGQGEFTDRALEQAGEVIMREIRWRVLPCAAATVLCFCVWRTRYRWCEVPAPDPR